MGFRRARNIIKQMLLYYFSEKSKKFGVISLSFPNSFNQVSRFAGNTMKQIVSWRISNIGQKEKERRSPPRQIPPRPPPSPVSGPSQTALSIIAGGNLPWVVGNCPFWDSNVQSRWGRVPPKFCEFGSMEGENFPEFLQVNCVII